MPEVNYLQLAIVLAGIIATWAVMKFKTDSYGRQIEKLWDYKDKHEEEAGKERLTLHQKIASLEGMVEARAKENVEVLRRLEHIDRTLSSTFVEMKEAIAELKARLK